MPNLINSYSLSSVIGIGTDTPNQNLTVVGGISGNALVYDQTGNSSQWNSVYTSVKANSGSYATTSYVQSNYLNLTGGTVRGSVTFTGNISAQGSAYFANTFFTTTSALCAVVNSQGPGLYIIQKGSGDIASFYDGNTNGEVMHIGASLGLPGVGIYTSNPVPGIALTVNGSISSNKVIYASGGNSNLWNSAYNYVNSTSATNNPTYNATTFSKLSSQAYTLIPSTSSILPTIGNNQSIGSVCSYVGSGQNNNICATNTSIYAGACNYNVSIFSGCNNTVFVCSQGVGLDTGACICNTFIGGGVGNSVIANTGYDDGHIQNSTILNGCNNSICQNGWDGGGAGSICTSTIVGGTCNALSGFCITDSVIGGGVRNRIISSSNSNYLIEGTVIAGGYNNVALGCYVSNAVIGGGLNNCNLGNYGVIVGGNTNKITSCCGGNFIGGGTYNTESGYNGSSFIGGGYCNTTSGYSGTDVIVGGAHNTSSAYNGNNFIGAGYCNCIDGTSSECNTGSSVIVGGGSNYVLGANSSIVGGAHNSLSASQAFIGGGFYNCGCGDYSIIGAGSYNCISLGSTDSSYAACLIAAFIGSGNLNVICSYNYGYINSHSCITNASIINGCSNTINTVGCSSQFGCNTCAIINNTVIGSGNSNCVTACSYDCASAIIDNVGILNGYGNVVCMTADGINENTGASTCTQSSLKDSTIIGGRSNVISSRACINANFAGISASTIVGGYKNCIQNFNSTSPLGSMSFIAGGCCNTISGACNVFVLGSNINAPTNDYTYTNNICSGIIIGSDICVTGIPACSNQWTSAYTMTKSNSANWNTAYQTVSTIPYTLINATSSIRPIRGNNTASGTYSSIAGGAYNISSGLRSFIAAGSGNDTKGFANTFILGTGLSATAANYTYVNNISSQGAIAAAGIITSNYSGATDSSLLFTGRNDKGGGGAGNYYNDFIRVVGGNGIASMYLRANYTGGIEFLNSPYTATTLTVSQSGMIGLKQTTVQTNNIPSNNAISFNGHSYINDDGNLHITASDGSIWINTNSSSDIVLNGQNSSGGVQAFGTFRMNSGYGSVAPVYGVRAWINFSVNTSNGAITTNGSGNLSVSRSGTGTYVFTFGTAMPDANYSVTATAQTPNSNSDVACNIANGVSLSTTGFTLQTARYGTGNEDATLVCVQVVR